VKLKLKERMMKKFVLTAFAMLLLGLPVVAQADYVVDLVADGGDATTATVVGTVTVANDGIYLYVLYEITEPGWALTETHLHISETGQAAIPQKKGNPIPGQFDYATPDAGDSTYALFQILIDAPAVMSSNGKKVLIPAHDWTGALLTIAAHGVVEQWGCDPASLEALLPEAAILMVTKAVDESEDPEPDLAYFSEVLIESLPSPTVLDGSYIGWCVDIDSAISSGYPYVSGVFSTYGTIPGGLMDTPENLPLVNYILNQDLVGQPSGCDGVYTYGDVQQAIWFLLENGRSGYPQYAYSLGPWLQCRVDEILADAIANGQDFVPGCGECAGVIIIPDQPVEDPRQAVLVMLCGPGGDETVWGGRTDLTPETDGNGWGMDFTGSDWGMYFLYNELVVD
jgi:hypothetical protein